MSGRSPQLQLQVELPCRVSKLDFTPGAQSRRIVFALVLRLGHVNLGVGVRIDRMMGTGGALDGFDEAVKALRGCNALPSNLGYVVMMGALKHHD